MRSAIHQSYWLRNLPRREPFAALRGEHRTEVLVIGAGITGLSVAAELLARDHRVTVCEAQTLGAGTTGGSTGHLDAHPEMGPKQLVDRLGADAARDYTQLRLEAIRKISERSDVHCQFQRVPAYQYSESISDQASLREQWQAARQIGLNASWQDSVPIARAACGYQIESMGRIDIVQYLVRLAAYVMECGGKIFERTKVSSPAESHPDSLETPEGTIHFDHVVCATHCNYTDSMRLYAETPPYQSYALAARLKEALPDALFWDNSVPYYYTRRVSASDERLVLVGGCDHRTGDADEVEASHQLEGWLRERFDVDEIVASWSAELFEPVDGLPMIGKVPGKDNVWVATGLSGVGLTLGTVAGEMISKHIEDEPVPLAESLSPSRWGLAGVGTLVSELATSGANYAERLLGTQHVDPERLQPGEGATGMVDGHQVAVCRDEQGCEHRLSPLCKHMGGVVHWNAAEQTWDCPVHGGRYAADGQRIYGPPEESLSESK